MASQTPVFRYSPGDGRTYTWDGITDHPAVVNRHESQGDPPVLRLVPTDTVSMDGVTRTAQAFMAAITAWREERVRV